MRVGRAAANVTTKRTGHESQGYKQARTKSRPDKSVSINTPDNHETGDGIQIFGRLCLPRCSRAKFTTTAAGKKRPGASLNMQHEICNMPGALDRPVPAIVFAAILFPAILFR